MRAIPLAVKQSALALLVLVCSASMCLYWSRITNAVHASSASSPVLKPKVLTDLYPIWYATRELLIHHRDPYGANVSRELQIAYYGKELDPSRPEERLNQQRFAYPLYFVFFVAPLALVQFHTAQIIVWWLLAAGAALSVVLWLRFLRLRLSLFSLAILFTLVLTSIPVLQNLSILQPFLLPACFIAGAAVAVSSERLFLAGALLGLATVKPQVCLLLLAWFVLWTCSDWKRRRSLLSGFTITLFALTLASTLVQPRWLILYPSVLKAYAEYTKAKSFLGVVLLPSFVWPATILALVAVADFCWRARRQAGDSTAFAIALSLVLILTVSIIPSMDQPFNHVLLLPAVLLVIRHWRELRQGNALTRTAIFVFCLSALLPWPLAMLAVANPFSPHRDWLLKMWSVPLAASMALPFAAFGALILLGKARPLQSASKSAGSGPLQSTGRATGQS
jgi:Glycosyltransferase family 87